MLTNAEPFDMKYRLDPDKAAIIRTTCRDGSKRGERHLGLFSSKIA